MPVLAIVSPVVRTCRLVTAALIAGVRRDHSVSDVSHWLEDRPATSQSKIIAASLGMLAAGAYFAAQFGPIGILAYLMAVILIVR